ncbi:MAG: hypothetical protein ACXQTU_04895 [Candidatus Nezhaarchaeales archaeon]
MKKLIFLALLVALALSLVIVHAQEQTIVEISDKVMLDSQELFIVKFHGEERVIVVYSTPPQVSVEVRELSASSFEGLIALGILNTSNDKVYKCELLFSSIKPFNLTLIKFMHNVGEVELRTYQCPGNITFKLIVPLASKSSISHNTNEVIVPISFWSIEPWKIAVYCVFIPLFGVTALLDLKDMKRRKAGRWSINDSIALVLRYMFYAFMLSFIAIAIGTFGMFVYSSATSFSIDLKFGDLLTSFILFSVVAVFYGLARWRGWYELIDEED